jgi:tRNA(adenine34) deaminase
MALAERAAVAGDVPIGAVLYVDGLTFAGWNEKEARPDPTAHAEMIVLAAAARTLARWRIGGTLYITKEPCPMCAGAIAAARIERVVFALTAGVLAEETAAQLRAFFAARRGPE